MKYILLQKRLSVNKIEKFCTLKLESPIKDICMCKNTGVLFLTNYSIGLINLEGDVFYPWVTGFNQLSSACFDGKNSCYLVELNGSEIKKLQLSTRETQSILDGVANCKKIKLYFSKVNCDEDNDTAITYAQHKTLYWVSSLINRCFKIKDISLEHLVGNGKEGYSLSNDPKSCMLNKPSGIASNNGDVYISDANSCIRIVNKDGISLVAGRPGIKGHEDGKESLLTHPTKIKTTKRTVYFIDDNKIKSLSYSDNTVTTIANFERVVSIDVDDQNLYIMQEV